MPKLRALLPLIACSILYLYGCKDLSNNPDMQFSVTISDSLHSGTLDGRLLLILSDTGTDTEPRNLVRDNYLSAQVFGMDVNDWKKGEIKVFTGTEYGAPLSTFDEIPEGEYNVQVLLHKYETFKLASGLHKDNQSFRNIIRKTTDIFFIHSSNLNFSFFRN